MSQGAYSVWLVSQGLSPGWRVGRSTLLTSAHLRLLYPASLVTSLTSLQSSLLSLALGPDEVALLAGLSLLQGGNHNLQNKGLQSNEALVPHSRGVQYLQDEEPRVSGDREVEGSAGQELEASLQRLCPRAAVEVGGLLAAMAACTEEHMEALQQYRQHPAYSQVCVINTKILVYVP